MINNDQRDLLLLSIDDEESMREVVKGLAELEGFRTIGACGKKAIESALDMMPDVIVLDLTMPDVDGFEVIWSLIRRNSRAQIILLSAFDPRVVRTAAVMAKAAKLNLFDSLHKSVEPAVLREKFAAVRNFLI